MPAGPGHRALGFKEVRQFFVLLFFNAAFGFGYLEPTAHRVVGLQGAIPQEPWGAALVFPRVESGCFFSAGLRLGVSS